MVHQVLLVQTEQMEARELVAQTGQMVQVGLRVQTEQMEAREQVE